MDRLLISLAGAALLALLLYLTAVLFTLMNAVVPIWILGVLGAVLFVVALAIDILTSAEPKPEPRPQDEE